MTSHRANRDHSSAAFYSSGQQLEHGFLDFTKTMPQLLVTSVSAPSVVELNNRRSLVSHRTNRDQAPAVLTLMTTGRVWFYIAQSGTMFQL